MRWRVLVMILCLFLAGCASAPAEPVRSRPGDAAADPGSDQAEDLVAAMPTMLVYGDFTWHEPQATPNGAIGQAEAAAQTVVPGCLDPGTGHPDDWNLELGAVAGVPNGTLELDIQMSWDPTSYVRDELVLAYRPAGAQAWELSPYVRNGQNVSLAIDAAGWEAPGRATEWEYAACLVREEHRNIDAGAAWRPGSFRGVLHVEVQAIG